jgi:hypothetical protein
MKHIFSMIALAGLMPVLGFSCLSGKKVHSEPFEEKAVPPQTIVPDTFVLPLLPETMKDPEERAKYLVLHYWDRFDFADRKLIVRPEITEQAFVDYINIFGYTQKEVIDASLVNMMHLAEADTMMYVHFMELFEKYFYDPNSPFRNEEYYLPVLREASNSPLLAEGKRSRYAFQLDMALRNRIGTKANDFAYMVSSGQSLRMYDLKSDYILLMFTDPGCSTCASVTKRLNESGKLNGVLSKNNAERTMLAILAIAPDSSTEEWSAHIPDMPARWIYAYDKSGEITQKKLYDIRAFPTLYLLDKDKRVILKDTSVEAIEAFFSVH